MTSALSPRTDHHEAVHRLLQLAEQEQIQVEENAGMARFTSYGTGGPAMVMATPEDTGQLLRLLQWTQQYSVPCFVLGGGTNLLVSDQGYPGLVIKLGQQGEFGTIGPVRPHPPGTGGPWDQPHPQPPLHGGESPTRLVIGGAASLSRLVSTGIRQGLEGVMGLAGIPGTTGGAVAGNAGTRDGAMGDGTVGVQVCLMDRKQEQPRTLLTSRGELSFSYRASSITADMVITRVYWESSRLSPALVQERVSTRLAERRAVQPPGLRTAGSVFKNPPGTPGAGYLLEKAGMKGKTRGKSAYSTLHANFIITEPGACSGEIMELMAEGMDRVHSLFQVQLEPETRLLGF